MTTDDRAPAGCDVGEQYPERFPACHCRANARLMQRLHPELVAVEGYLVFPGAEGFEPPRLEHAWNLTPDGQVVDSTGWAYEGLRPFRYEAARSLPPP